MFYYVLQKEVMENETRPIAVQEVNGEIGDAAMILHQILSYDWANKSCLKSDVIVLDENLAVVKTDCFDRRPVPEPEETPIDSEESTEEPEG